MSTRMGSMAISVLAITVMVLPAAAQTATQITIGRNVQVSRAHATATHYEVLVAADPRDASKMIIGSFLYPARGLPASSVVYATRDGGQAWQPTLQGEVLLHTSDPAPAYGPDGTAYYTAASLGPASTPREDRKMLLFRSPDGGFKWEGPFAFTYSDRQYVTVDATGGPFHGRIYVNGNNRVPFGVSDFIVFWSTDGGRTFSGPGKREGFGNFVAAFMGNAVVASDGRLIGVFSDGKLLQAIASTDGGESLQPAMTIDNNFVAAGHRKGAHNNVMSMPVIAIDPGSSARKDHLYVVWADRRSGLSRIFFSASADHGATWSAARTIDDRPASDSTDHFMPTVAVNKDGVVGVMWYDRRRHPDNLGWDVRFTASTDGGKTFLPSVQVSEQGTRFGATTPWPAIRTSVAQGNAPGSGITIDFSLNSFTFLGGDTNGLVADAAGAFHPVWVDNRTGVPQIWTASVNVAPAAIARGDVSDKVTIEFLETDYRRAGETLEASVRLRNTSGETVRGPFRVRVVEAASELGDLTVVGANGGTNRGAEWAFGELSLAPGAVSRAQTWRFALSNLQPFQSGNRYRLGLARLKVVVTNDAVSAAQTSR